MMRADRLVQVALVALVGALVVAGLWTTGGPQTAQEERRDAVRISDLDDLSYFARCVADGAGGALPETLAPDAACSTDTRFADPFTGMQYRYIRSSPIAFQLCAKFERPERLERQYRWRGSFSASTGCFNVHYGD